MTELETQIQTLNAEGKRLNWEISEAHEAFESWKDKTLASGKTLATLSKQEQEEAGRLGKVLDDLRDERVKVAERSQAAMSEHGNLRERAGGSSEYAGRIGRAPLGLTSEGIRELHEAAQHGQTARVGYGLSGGMYASGISPTTFPPSGAIQYDFQLEEFLRERVRVADYIPWEAWNGPIAHWFRAETAASAAAPVAPGGQKPESTPTWAEFSAPMVKIAHWSYVFDEVLKDYASWADVVSGSMIGGLITEENSQILVGDGTGLNMRGLLNTSGIYSIQRDTTNETKLDALLRGITRLRTGTAFCSATLIVLNPEDYLSIRTLKAVDSGVYLAGDPVGPMAPDLWSIPTIVTTTIPVGQAMVANLGLAAKTYWREFPVFEVNRSAAMFGDQTYGVGGGLAEWTTNKTLVRAEERLVVAVRHPAAICEVVLD